MNTSDSLEIGNEQECETVATHEMVSKAEAEALYKIGEGLQDLSRAWLARLELKQPSSRDEELDVSGETPEGRRRRQAIILRALERADGRLHKDDLYAVARSVGYDNRGLAGFSTTLSNLIEIERRDGAETGYRILTEVGRRRLAENRHLLPAE